MCIKSLQDYVAAFQERRAKVTDAVIDEFMAVRKLEWNGNPKLPRAELVVPVKAEGDAEEKLVEGDGKLTKNQQKKLLKEQQIAQKKAEKAAAKVAAKEGGAEPAAPAASAE